MNLTDLLQTPEAPLLLSETDAAAVLRMSQPTLNRHARRGTLPAGIRPIWLTPNRRVYNSAELLAYLGLSADNIAGRAAA